MQTNNNEERRDEDLVSCHLVFCSVFCAFRWHLLFCCLFWRNSVEAEKNLQWRNQGFGKAALNDREENGNWVGEYNENDVDDHGWANDYDAANKDEKDEDQSDIENEEGGKYEDEKQDTIEEEDKYEVEGKELSDLAEGYYDDDDADDYDDDDDADDLSDKSDLAK